MEKIAVLVRIKEELIVQFICNVSTEVAEKLKNNEEVTIRISVIPKENEDKE